MGKDAEKGCYQIDKNLSEVPQSSEGPYSLYLHTDLFWVRRSGHSKVRRVERWIAGNMEDTQM